VPGRYLAQDIWRDSHVLELCWRKNSGRWTRPRVRRALATPEHALSAPPTRVAPRHANPASTPLPVAIKATPALTVHPCASLTQPELEFAGVCPENGVPVAALAKTTLDRQTSHSPSRPTLGLASTDLGEAPQAKDWIVPRGRRRIDVARLQPAVVARKPSSTVSHSSIPCTYSILSIPWSSMCHLIEPYRREQAGAHAADELDRLRTRSDLFWPSPSTTRTWTWPPGPPESHPALHWTSLTAGKPRHPFSSPRLLFQGGRSLGWKKEKPGGILRSQWLRNSSAGVWFKGLVKGNPRGLGANWFSLNLLNFILLNAYITCKIDM
jgi:hypothetical protein